MTPLLSARGVVKRYRHRTGWIRAVDGVSLEIYAGEAVGLVGESGCGKSTLARLLVGLERPTAGEILFRGRPLPALSQAEYRQFRRAVQIIFQSPLLSLDPRLTIGQSVAEPLRVQGTRAGRQVEKQVAALLEEVGLDPVFASRYPAELSGGQRQRVAIARAVATRPALIVCDEPVASFDLSIQRQILTLLIRLQASHGIAYCFISHQLGVVGTIAHRVLVMYQGRLVEEGANPAIFQQPRHPYSQTLIACASPTADWRKR